MRRIRRFLGCASGEPAAEGWVGGLARAGAPFAVRDAAASGASPPSSASLLRFVELAAARAG